MRRWIVVSTVASLVAALVLSGCGGSDTQLDKSEPWDLVWISDSMGEQVSYRWADQIEEAEGVEVRVHDYVIGFLSMEKAQQMITNDATIREQAADAEIIVVYGNNSDTGPADYSGTCHTPSPAPRDPPNVYTPADFAPYGDALRGIYDVIFELRSGQPTVIRGFDVFNGMIADWRAAGIDPECTAFWDSESEVLHEAADDYGVAMASFYNEFNGVDHDEDPREKGYISVDGFHASTEGVDFQAEILHTLGYDAIVP